MNKLDIPSETMVGLGPALISYSKCKLDLLNVGFNRFEFREMMTGNVRDNAHWTRRKRQADSILREIIKQKNKLKLKKNNDKFCTLVCIRHIGKGRKFQDKKNFAWACKALVDGFKRSGLIVDDSYSWINDYYFQYRDSDGKEFVEVFYSDNCDNITCLNNTK